MSGIVRDAFRASGHEAVSCDILPCLAPGPHLQCDVRAVLADGWDLMIAHPPCTYLCNSGIRWLHADPDRWPRMLDAAGLFRTLMDAPVPRIAVENPIPHKYARALIGRPSRYVHPWQHGHAESKTTGLWIKGLPLLLPSALVDGRSGRMHRMSQGPDRAMARSITYPGIATAMADQWG